MSRFSHHGFWQCMRVAAVTATLATLGVGCPTTSELGDIEVTILRAVDSEGQLCPVTSVSWQLDPVSVPPRPSGSTIGTTARPATFTNYSGGTGTKSRGTPQFPIVCVHTATLSALAPGTWAVTGKAVRGNAFTCNKVVRANTATSATWVFNQGGTAESCS
jgi:hypothetical protein